MRARRFELHYRAGPETLWAPSLTHDKIITDAFTNRERLKELRVTHRDLDDLIDHLSHDPIVDHLRLRRLKKRKLMLKDSINRLESELIPDLNA